MNEDSAPKLTIRDDEEIRPDRLIPQKDIDEVNVRHRSLAQAVLTTALEIGFKLRSWRDLMPHGKWLKWCAINLPNISERSIQVYLKLWEHNDLIQAHLKSAAAADLPEPTEFPSIRDALSWIKSPAPVSRPKEKRTTRPRQLDIEATVIPRPTSDSTDPASAKQIRSQKQPPCLPEPPQTEPLPPQISITAEQLTQLCPQCRALLTANN
jgi:Protein of unknown function (DUF3102)